VYLAVSPAGVTCAHARHVTHLCLGWSAEDDDDDDDDQGEKEQSRGITSRSLRGTQPQVKAAFGMKCVFDP